ncbi:hypothetical protein ES708_23450 [subsurface metagenome]
MIDLYFIQDVLLPPLIEGVLVTIKLIILSIPSGLILGILIAVGRVYGNKFISSLCAIYTIFFRGTPLLVQLFIIYYALPSVGIFFSPFMAALRKPKTKIAAVRAVKLNPKNKNNPK